MRTVSTEEITAYAHCMQFLDEFGAVSQPGPQGETMTDQQCPGYAQQEVAAIRETVAHLYGEAGSEYGGQGASAHAVSTSTSRLCWADPEQAPCPFCGVPRELSEQQRPRYPRLTGQPQDQLLRFKAEERRAITSTATAVERLADTVSEQAAMREEIASLRAEVAELRSDDKPARKPAVKSGAR